MYLCSDRPHFPVVLLTDSCHTCGYQIKTAKWCRPAGTAVLSWFNPAETHFILFVGSFLLLSCSYCSTFVAGDNSAVLKDSVSPFDTFFIHPIRSVQQCEMHTKMKIYGTSNIGPKCNNRISNERTVNKGSRFFSHDQRLCVDSNVWKK